MNRLIRWMWVGHPHYAYVIYAITEKSSGRVTETILEKFDTADEAIHKTLELRQQRDSLYHTEYPKLSQSDAS